MYCLSDYVDLSIENVHRCGLSWLAILAYRLYKWNDIDDWELDEHNKVSKCDWRIELLLLSPTNFWNIHIFIVPKKMWNARAASEGIDLK